jgi:N utilization substance protein A
VEDIENDMKELVISDAQKVDPEAQVDDELGFQIFYLQEDSEKAKEEDKKYGDLLKLRTHRNEFGRRVHQTAKYVLLQKIQEAERIMIFNEYKDRKGDLMTGVARRFEKGNVIVDLGRTEAILPLKEQAPRESYRVGERVQAFVKDVLKDTKGPQIILSRIDPRFVIRLFEKEVPEIYEGIVKIVSIAREPGERTKIAVTSTDVDVDPVGACVGMKGARVQAIVQELRGEKIDIVPFSHDPARYVCNAIAPAEVQKVFIDEGKKAIELIVADDQLSLAIGKKGQNVKLATKLTEWKIEIHSETKIEEMKKALKNELLTVEGLDSAMIEYLFKLGYHSIDNIISTENAEFMNIHGLTEEIVEKMKKAATVLKERREQEITAVEPKPDAPAENNLPVSEPASPASETATEPASTIEPVEETTTAKEPEP